MAILIPLDTHFLINILSGIHADDDSLHPFTTQLNKLEQYNYVFEPYMRITQNGNEAHIDLRLPNIELIMLSDSIDKLIEHTKTWTMAYSTACVNVSKYKNASLRVKPLGEQAFNSMINDYYPDLAARFNFYADSIWEG